MEITFETLQGVCCHRDMILEQTPKKQGLRRCYKAIYYCDYGIPSTLCNKEICPVLKEVDSIK